MKHIFILINKLEEKNINGFFDRKEMTLIEAKHLNEDLKDLIWVLTPNY